MNLPQRTAILVSGSNNGVSTSEDFTSNANQSSSSSTFIETSQNETNNSSSDFIRGSFLLRENLDIDSDILRIKSHISGENSISEKDKDGLQLVFTIESNKQNILTPSILNNIKSYKLKINNNLYDKLENKANMLFSLNSNNKKFVEIFFNSVKDFDEIETNIKNGIEEKTNKIKINNFESLLKSYVLEEKNNSKYFNKITNSFIKNISLDNEDKFIFENSSIKDFSYANESTLLRFANKDFFEKHNLITLTSNKENDYIKDIRTTTNDMIIQNIVSMIRNLYFISPRSLIGNYKSDLFVKTNYDTESFVCFKNEDNDLDVFKSINFSKDSISIDRMINSSIFKKNIDSHLASTRQVFLDNTITSLNGIQYLPSEISNYIDEVMIENLKNANHIKTNQTGESPSAIFLPHEVTVAKEINKYYTGNFFDIDLSKLEIIKDLGIYELLARMAFGLQEPNIVINLFKENYLDKRNNEIIYKYQHPVTTYIENRSNNLGQIRSSDYLNIDQEGASYIDNLEYKIKIDSFTKKQKLKLLKIKKVKLDFCKQIIDNIKKTNLKNKMIAYTKNDNESLSVINKENDIFKLLFTEDDDIVYSHIDLITDHLVDNTRYLGIDSMKKKDINVNSEYTKVRDNIKNLFSNYYPTNSFTSSSKLFKEILSSIVSEASVSDDVEYEDFNLTQILYFNFFKKDFSDNDEVKNLISERFIKKAIQLDTVSDRSFRISNKLKTYSYDINNIIEDDFDNTSKSEMNSYIESVLNSSSKLKKIKESIFGLNNIKSLKQISDYKRISNQGFKVSGYDEEYNVNYYSLTAIINFNILPHYCMLYNFASGGKFSEEANITYHIEKNNGLIENITYGEINNETGEREVVKEVYSINRRNQDFDVTKSINIKNKIIPKLCKSDTARENNLFPYVIIEDCFDKIFKSNNSQNYVFYKIIDMIQDMLRLNIENYEDLSFSSEDELNTFLDKYSNIKSEVITLIELFTEIYLLYSARIQRVQALKIFSWQKKDIQQGVSGGGNNLDFPYNGIIAKHSNVYNKFKNIMSLNSGSDNIDIISKDQTLDTVKDIKEICDMFDNNIDSFLQNIELESTSTNWKTHITNKLYNIMHSLFVSDVSQAFTFDIVNGFINHQDFIIESERDDITSSENFNKIDKINVETVEEIENNFHNLFYINNLSKKLSKISFKNEINNKLYSNRFNTSGIDFYKNTSIFENLKNIEKENIENTGRTIHDTIYSKEVFLDNKDMFINSNISSFGIKSKFLNNRSYDSIVKITVSIVDKFNLNNFYVPKVFIFSPMISDVLYLTSDMINNSNISNIGSLSSLLCVYNIKENIKNRLNIFRYQDLIEDENHFIVDILKSKFNLNSNDGYSLFRYLINCHLGSNELSKIISNVYNIDNIKSYKEMKTIDEDIFDLADSLDEKQFFDVFDSNKDIVFEDFTIDEEDKYIVPLGYNTIDKNNTVYSLLHKLNDISSSSSIESFINNEYYDIYNVAINPKSFYYIDTSLNTKTASFEPNSLQNLLNKIQNLDEFVNNNKLETSNLEIDNFNIIFKTEIL